jgi:excinuclease ABC subunit C
VAGEYARAVAGLTRFLSGHAREVLADWRREMRRLSRELRYEESAERRDRIQRLEGLMEAQRLADPERPDLDAVGFAARGERAAAAVFSHRGGAVVGAWRLLARRAGEAGTPEILEALLTDHYQARQPIPGRVLCDPLPRDPGLLERWLSERAGHRVRLLRPQRGRGAALVAAARENAALFLEEHEALEAARRARLAPALYALQESLGLARPPRRIEGYDISNLQGRDAVGSRVVFRDGRPLKRDYRRYRIRTVQGADDVSMLAEVLARRLRRLGEDPQGVPDLILVDGGRGQVARVARVLADHDARDAALVGLAKREEEIFLPGRREPLRLPRASAALQLLQRVRDEAHRFALGYHHRLRARGLGADPLARIPGVGPRRQADLIRTFGSLAALRRAPPEAIARVPGIGGALAGRIADALRGEAPGA